jgi:hypothetical protein
MKDPQPNPFAKLSTEIIWAIIGFVPPASHLDFACVCKHIARCSSDVLQLHRNAHEKYHVTSDLDPATVPVLLRSGLEIHDPIPAWYELQVMIRNTH